MSPCIIADLSFFLMVKAISYIYLSILTLIINLISKTDPLHIKKYALQNFYGYFDKEKQIGHYITYQSFCSVWRI